MGERLALARAAKGMTQRAFAAQLGVSPATIAMYERGLRTPPGPVLIAMARLLGVSAESLLPPIPSPVAANE